ncbi:MAG: hypothetical protein KDA21_09395, partial [Phycisphaerales bacterium]|nr:hypothetical protein [Phycisphaerales bacterium]
QLDACGWDHAFNFQLDIQAPMYQAVYDSGQILAECCDPHMPPTCSQSGPASARGENEPANCNGGQSDGGCDGETDGSAEAPVVNSSDPNIKVGPLGSGVERWVNAESPLAYRIGFENIPEATAPAAFVRIEDPLPETLAPGSFRLGTIQIGDTLIEVPDGLLSYQATVDLTSTRGVLLEITAGVDAGRTPPTAFWIFRSIDPLTGAPPADPNLGFLPPNDDSGAGQGWVGFTIRPASDIQHLDVITNAAEITFDANEPIITDAVFNTIDSIAPMSTLDPLPLVVAPGTAVPVTFRGTDDDTGSGLAGIRVLVSDEGNAYDSLVGFVQSESTTFIGEPGHVYRFASQAVDHARNYEPLMTYDDLVIAIPGVALDPSSDSGITGDLVTNDSTPLLIVTGAPNGNATITIEGVGRASRAEIGIGPDGKGIWQPETPLQDGDHNVTVTSGGVSHVTLLTVDTLPPAITQWAFVTDHGPAGTAMDVIPAGGAYAEPRIDAPSRLRTAIDPADRATDLAAILQPTLIGISEDG